MVFDFERWGLTPPLRAAFSDAQSSDFPHEIINFNATVPEPTAPHGPHLARVIGARRGPRFDLITAAGPGEGVPRGALFAGDPADAPVVGDWVRVRPLEPGRWVVEAVLPRLGVLARRGAGEADQPQIMLAHVDHLWVVGGLDGDFNPRRIERMLLAARTGDIPATVLLNKADLCADPSAFIARLNHPEALAVSAHTGQGLDALRAHRRPGETVALPPQRARGR